MIQYVYYIPELDALFTAWGHVTEYSLVLDEADDETEAALIIDYGIVLICAL